MTHPQDQEYSTEEADVTGDADLAESGADRAMATDTDVVVAEVIDAEVMETEPAQARGEGTNGSSDLSRQWRDIQARFVDDPRGAVQLAAEAADGALGALVSNLHDRRSALLPATSEPASQDTERLRSALQQYRMFCEGIEDLGQRLPEARTAAR